MPRPVLKLLWKPWGVAHLTYTFWALSPSPFRSAPINFRGPLGTSQVLCRTHFAHTLFFLEHSSPYIHSANLHKTLSARRASSSFIHFQQTSSSFLLWHSSCLEDAVCKLLLKAALFFPQIPPHPFAILLNKSHICSSSRAPHTDQCCLLCPSNSPPLVYSSLIYLGDMEIYVDYKYFGCPTLFHRSCTMKSWSIILIKQWWCKQTTQKSSGL